MLRFPLIVTLATAACCAAQSADSINVDQFAGQIAKTLEQPVAFRSAYLKDWQEFTHALRVASIWPRPEFREPLRRILHGDDPQAVLSAASGLLNYRRPGLRREVAWFAYDRREYNVGCFVLQVGHGVQSILARRARGIGFASAGDALVFRNPDFMQLDVEVEGMTVPIAATALDDRDLSVRLQAFWWLAQNGIVFKAEPLREAWPLLSDEMRTELLQEIERIRLGTDILRSELERILSESAPAGMGDSARGELLKLLASLGSELARNEADRIIRAQIENVNEIEAAAQVADERSLLEYAFSAWGRGVSSSDLERVLEWTRTSSKLVRAAGYFALAGLDDGRAIDAVIAYLDSAECEKSREYLLVVWERLQEREWRDGPAKWRYVRYLVSSLEREAAKTNAETKRLDWSGWTAIRRVETLAAITQAFNGETGVRPPMGGVEAKTANATAENWKRWLSSNDPEKTR